MSKYDSLAEQVAEDFRITMLAMSSMNKTMNREFKRLRRAIRKTYGTIQLLLQHDEATDARLDALESWQKQVEVRLSA